MDIGATTGTTHRQERLDTARAWQVVNRDRYATYLAAYHVAHREVRLAAMRTRDARVRGARIAFVAAGPMAASARGDGL